MVCGRTAMKQPTIMSDVMGNGQCDQGCLAGVELVCHDEVVPLQKRIETERDDSDLEEVKNTERHLLFVAWTRARNQLLATGVEPGFGFPEDLRM